MWIHRDKRIAFIANPRAGSREIGYNTLRGRGFETFCGHHGVPWGPGYLRPEGRTPKTGDQWWWWNQSLLDWTFYGVHRNHFEVFHSLAYVVGMDHFTVENLTNYLWVHSAHYRCAGVLFASFFEVATCRPLRFGHLREDVSAMLDRHYLRPLADEEFRRERAITHTNGKPRGEHYRDVITPDIRQWIETNYRAEMELFGYGWEDENGGP